MTGGAERPEADRREAALAPSGNDGDAVGGGWTCDRPRRETIGETGQGGRLGTTSMFLAVRADA